MFIKRWEVVVSEAFGRKSVCFNREKRENWYLPSHDFSFGVVVF